MRPTDDLPSLTPDERFGEVARILGAGVLRLHASAALSADKAEDSPSENSPNSASPGLEVSEETVLSVHNG